MNVLSWLRELFSNAFSREPIKVVIVRRYQDANGSYVGELYLHETTRRRHDSVTGYRMVGASLDTLPLEIMDPMAHTDAERNGFHLDTRNDFLAPIPANVVRVGALDPADNDGVRRMVARLPRRRVVLSVQNRFVEHVVPGKGETQC